MQSANADEAIAIGARNACATAHQIMSVIDGCQTTLTRSASADSQSHITREAAGFSVIISEVPCPSVVVRSAVRCCDIVAALRDFTAEEIGQLDTDRKRRRAGRLKSRVSILLRSLPVSLSQLPRLLRSD